MTFTPDPEQTVALRAFANAYGRKWKSELMIAWANGWSRHGGYSASWVWPLQQLRNTPGLSLYQWLTAFRLPKTD